LTKDLRRTHRVSWIFIRIFKSRSQSSLHPQKWGVPHPRLREGVPSPHHHKGHPPPPSTTSPEPMGGVPPALSKRGGTPQLFHPHQLTKNGFHVVELQKSIQKNVKTWGGDPTSIARRGTPPTSTPRGREGYPIPHSLSGRGGPPRISCAASTASYGTTSETDPEMPDFWGRGGTPTHLADGRVPPPLIWGPPPP
jgi:hypothetical protein